ncbi:LamG domain-containing protein [Streptomyces sp. NBC_01317]|uniref:LamG domain-containing protein n=1 Tax=Streptomyces sp. NBC_01317 TaxID=2903822 RepID=UPI002E147D82|nr:LamG domain-containing protein [Streptomyces sp. NBC_01317]
MKAGQGRGTGRLPAIAVAVAIAVGALPSAAFGAPTHFAAPGAAEAATSTVAGAAEGGKTSDPSDAAASAARSSGANVEITSLRTESSEVYATPDGQLEAVQHLKPVRTRLDGRWKTIDNTLARRQDGTVTPNAAAVGLVLSGGGTTPVATLERAGKRLSFTWPTTLPTPSLAGDTATYANVLPDIDLQVTSATDGFSELLVVRTPEAAKDPRLATLKLRVDSPGLDLTESTSGGLEAVDKSAGGVVFQAPKPYMWDSALSASPAQGAQRKAALVNTPSAAPGAGVGIGDAANVAPIGVDVSPDGSELTLTPDQGMLKDSNTTFPVYIDPTTHTPKAGEWTMVSRYWASSPQWRFNGDPDAGVGYCGWDYCAPFDVKRIFYTFPTADFGGKSILSATFVARETWSGSCDGRSVELWRTKGFNSSTTWNSSSDNWLQKLDTRDVAKGNSSSCPAGDVEFDATSGVKYAATHGSSTTSFGLRASNEDDKYGWKRFTDDTYLRVKFNQSPKQVAMSQLVMEPGGSCKKPENKISIRSLPKITANGVKDPDGDEVSVQFQVWWDSGSGFAAQWTSAKMAHDKSGSNFSTRLTETLSNGKKIPKNKTVAWFVRAVDYDEGKSYSYSPWSAAGSATGCYFVWDTSVPPGPTVASGDYPAVDDSDSKDPSYDGVGQYGTFTISSTDTTVTKYWFGVNEEPSSANQLTTTGGAARTVSFRPTRSGTNFVFAKSFDAAGNASEPVSYRFRVKAGQPVRAQWSLDEDTGATQAVGSGGERTLDLHGGPVLGAPGVPGVSGTAMSLDGTDDFAQSDIPTVDTSSGFSVSAWAKLDKVPDAAAVIAAQPGNNAPGFELYYSKTFDRWAFNQYVADTPNATPVRVMQATAGGVKASEWVHLAGTYNSGTDELSLYVNGAVAGSVPYTQPWSARRGLQIGAGSYAGAQASFFPGTVDDVRLYDKPLSATEVGRLYTKQSGIGRPARAVIPLDDPATDDQGEPTTQVAGRAEVAPAVFKGGAKPGQPGRAGKALSLDGIDDYATAGVPHLNNQRSFSVAAWAKLPKTKPTHAAIIATQAGTVKPGFELYYSPTYGWAFNQYSADTADGAPVRAAQGDPNRAPGGEWTQVVGSYDAVTNDLRLYVQGKWVSTTKFDSPFYAGGAVQIGAGSYNGALDSLFPGQISGVQLYDRALSAPEIAELFDAQVSIEGRWKLDASSGTPLTSPDDLTREDHIARALSLGSGARIDASNTMVGTGGLLLGGTSTGFASTTTSPVDTASSFTVSAWVTAPSRPTKPVTVMSMAGTNTSGFAVRYVPDKADPANAGRWQLVMASGDSATAATATAESSNFQINSSWNHLAVVYDAYAGQMRLYVDGQLIPALCVDDDEDGNPDEPGCTESVPWNSSVLPFTAAKGLQLGRVKTSATTWGEYWSGAVDDVWAFAGAASDTQVAALASGQDIPTTPGPR